MPFVSIRFVQEMHIPLDLKFIASKSSVSAIHQTQSEDLYGKTGYRHGEQ